MSDDEKAIRELVATWLSATKAGDADTVLSLITDDVVFLQPGQPVMRKADFAAKSRAQSAQGAPRIDASSDIQEIKVLGDWAFMWTRLSVTMTPPAAGQPVTVQAIRLPSCASRVASGCSPAMPTCWLDVTRER